jgi:uncharacterized protein (TIGR03067 family)
MKLQILAVLAGSVLAIGASGQDKGKTDADKIQGTWSFVSLEKGGVEVMEDFVKEAKVVITADKIKMQFQGKEEQVDYKLDPSKKPPHIDIVETNGGKENLIKGIYMVDDKQLKVCFAPPGEKRPTELKSELGSSEMFAVLKRDKQ